VPRVTRAKAILFALLAVALLGLFASAAAAKPSRKAPAKKGPLPDLVVGKLPKVPAEIVAGSPLKLSLNVSDRGRVKAPGTRLGVYLAKGAKHTKKDHRLKQLKIKPLKGAKRAKVKLTLLLPASTAPGAYRLIVCADDSRRVREAKEGNDCAVGRQFTVAPRTIAPAFSINDAYDWGFARDAAGESPKAGRPIAVTLRAANGIAGQAGYSVAKVAAMPAVGGAVIPLDFSHLNLDDSAVNVPLPFPFPFGGLYEYSASVSTNGWIGFGSPAPDYFEAHQRDYRGEEFAVGEYERGIMPLWGNFNLEDRAGTGPGSVREVVPPDGSYVAFQWDTAQKSTVAPRRVVQLVLFRDGRFRFDYPGANLAGGEASFIGYSRGAGPGGLEELRGGITSVNSGSLQFTPNPVRATIPLDPGEQILTLPAGSSFLPSDPGCVATIAPTATQDGLASCQIPALLPGTEVAHTVTFAMPENAIGEISPANVRYLGTFRSGGLALTDGDELDTLSANLEATKIDLDAAYEPPPAKPKVGEDAKFLVTLQTQSHGGLDKPSATFILPANSNLKSIQIDGKNLPCSAALAEQATCPLPSGVKSTVIAVTVEPTPAATGIELTLGAIAQSLNTPVATATASSPAVEA
jgi:hypothetical protein